MRAELIRVTELQPTWQPNRSVEMDERGALLRRSIPQELLPAVKSFIARMPSDLQDLAIEGRDGTGLKSEIPWVRVYSRARSNSATVGWYLVYLFDAFGDRVFLSINQGTRQWNGADFAARDRYELVERAAWARARMFDDVNRNEKLVEQISLPTRRSDLGRSYEWGNVFALTYESAAMPDDVTLRSDFEYMLTLLTLLYEYVDNSLEVPGDPPPEVIDAVLAADEVAGRPRTGGRYRLDPEERRAIERHAVRITRDYLDGLGYATRDVGATESYDVDAKRGGEHLYVEVKGTVTSGAEVILTRNEVDLHRNRHPHNMLCVVTGIRLDTTGMRPVASEGNLRVITPWVIDEARLAPLSFLYSLPLAGDEIGARHP